MKWIGLTGGIATGKSTVKKLIEGLGFSVLDADLVSHQVTEVGAEGYEKIVSQFGKDILKSDLSIDRKKLGSIIFSDTDKKNELENILHPLIKEKVQKMKIQKMKEGAQFCFYDVPLLFEKNMQDDFDLVVMVWCDEKHQKTRLMQRNSFSEAEAMIRITAQVPLIDKIKKADFCIDNSGNYENLKIQVEHMLNNSLFK